MLKRIRPPSLGWAFRFRYAVAVLRRFRVSLVAVAVLFGVLPLIYVGFYEDEGGHGVSYGLALYHVYFLLFGQPTLHNVQNPALELLDLLIPPAGLLTVVDGGIRFGYLFFSKRSSAREWVELVAESMQHHVVVCGAGRVGFRVATQLLALKQPVVVVEKREDAPFVSTLRDMQVPVLIDDVRNPKSLERLNVAKASAIVCATDDDLTNLNVALDARKVNAKLRIVLRMFDEDLVQRVNENFDAQAHSTSALAASTLALGALDPRVVHSFEVGGHLMVVSPFVAGATLAALKVSELRDRFGALTLSMKTATTGPQLHPPGATQIQVGDVLTLQCTYEEYLALRTFTNETVPPRSLTSP